VRGLRVLHGGLDPHDDRDDGAADGGDHAEYDVFGNVLFSFELRSHGDPVDIIKKHDLIKLIAHTARK
jgi:hypothetical protein